MKGNDLMADTKVKLEISSKNVANALKYYAEHSYLDDDSMAKSLARQGYGWNQNDIQNFVSKNYNMDVPSVVDGMRSADPAIGAYAVMSLTSGNKSVVDNYFASVDHPSSIYNYIRVADNNPGYTKHFADDKSWENYSMGSGLDKNIQYDTELYINTRRSHYKINSAGCVPGYGVLTKNDDKSFAVDVVMPARDEIMQGQPCRISCADTDRNRMSGYAGRTIQTSPVLNTHSFKTPSKLAYQAQRAASVLPSYDNTVSEAHFGY